MKVDRRERERLESLRAQLDLPEEQPYRLEAKLVADEDPHPWTARERSEDAQG